MRNLFPTIRRDDESFTAFQRDIERLFGRVGRGLSPLLADSGFPALDVAEKDDAVTVEAADGGIVVRGEQKASIRRFENVSQSINPHPIVNSSA